MPKNPLEETINRINEARAKLYKSIKMNQLDKKDELKVSSMWFQLKEIIDNLMKK